MKYFIVHTPSYNGSYEGRTPVAASTAEKAIQKYCAYLEIGKPPKRYYAVEISKEAFDAYPEYRKLH